MTWVGERSEMKLSQPSEQYHFLWKIVGSIRGYRE